MSSNPGNDDAKDAAVLQEEGAAFEDEENEAPPPQQPKEPSKAVSFRDKPVVSNADDSDDEDDDGEDHDDDNHRDDKEGEEPRPARGYMDLATGSVIQKSKSVRLVRTSGARRRQTNRMTSWTRQAGEMMALGRLGILSESQMSSERSSTASVVVAPGVSQVEGAEAPVQPDEPEYEQYRILSRRKASGEDEGGLDFFLCRLHILESFTGSDIFLSIMNRFFYWCFRAGFWKVNIMFFGLWLYIIIWFGIFIYAVDQYQPECLVSAESAESLASADPTDKKPFMDAVHLSWTTLSTVGYGVISPGLPSTTSDGERCFGINLLMALEAFIGVIFGGLTGAVLFAKVARVQAFAPVQFSDPIAVAYGTGCLCDRVVGSTVLGEPGPSEAELSTRRISTRYLSQRQLSIAEGLPCPVLEFRIVNTNWNQLGGEIMDASLNLVCSRMESTDDKLKPKQLKAKKSKQSATKTSKAIPVIVVPPPPGSSSKQPATKTPNTVSAVPVPRPTGSSPPHASPGAPRKVSLLRKSGNTVLAAGNMIQQINKSIISDAVSTANSMVPSCLKQPHVEPYNSESLEQIQKEKEREQQIQLQEQVQSLLSGVVSRRPAFAFATPITVDEGGDLFSPPIVFHNLPVEADSHPYFKRVWTVRHVCNEHSPLLPRKVRHKIEQNNGFWPPELNSFLEVRKAINFHEIIVSISGKANASGASVYAQKVYRYVDMVVGYTFVPMLGNNKETGKLIVDRELLNDVVEQVGGGAEPIHAKDQPVFKGYVDMNVLFPFMNTQSASPPPSSQEEESQELQPQRQDLDGDKGSSEDETGERAFQVDS